MGPKYAVNSSEMEARLSFARSSRCWWVFFLVSVVSTTLLCALLEGRHSQKKKKKKKKTEIFGGTARTSGFSLSIVGRRIPGLTELKRGLS